MYIQKEGVKMEATTKIQKWGNSHGIRLPKIILDTVRWKENDTIEIIEQDGGLLLKPVAPKRKSIDELFAGYQGDYKAKEMDWGEKVGNEIW